VDGPGARAESITLTPSADTSIFEKAPLNNFGALQSVVAGNTASLDPARALVKFGIDAALPAGARITRASFELTVIKESLLVEAATFEMYRLQVDWGEGNKGAGLITGLGSTATAGESSWTARFQPNDLWSMPGGGAGADYANTRSAAADLTTEGTLIFESSAELMGDAQHWLDDPASNFGWLIKDQFESTSQTARRFGSREHPTEQPRLLLEFTSPPRISGAELMGNQFCLQFQAKAGKAYLVERRDLLDHGLWTTVTNLPPANTPESVVVCEPFATGSRFYRVRER